MGKRNQENSITHGSETSNNTGRIEVEVKSCVAVQLKTLAVEIDRDCWLLAENALRGIPPARSGEVTVEIPEDIPAANPSFSESTIDPPLKENGKARKISDTSRLLRSASIATSPVRQSPRKVNKKKTETAASSTASHKKIVSRALNSLRKRQTSPTRTLPFRKSLLRPSKFDSIASQNATLGVEGVGNTQFHSAIEIDVMEQDSKDDSISLAENTPLSPTTLEEPDVTNDDCSSDGSLQMHVLEKEVLSDKDEDNDDDDILLNSAYDTDESVLLSPSALPASELFRPFPRKKSKSRSGKSSSRSRSNLSACRDRQESLSPIPSPKFATIPQITEKRGRGRPRKYTQNVRKPTPKKTYRKKAKERARFDDEYDTPRPSTSMSAMANLSPSIELTTPSSCPDDQETLDENIDYEEATGNDDKWENGDTFVYAKHRFVGAQTNFQCGICNVSFTAPSSLKRHYGTIYHKQKCELFMENNGNEELNDDHNSVHDSIPNISAASGSMRYNSDHSRAPGVVRKKRTTTVVRRNAVDNIKKYYAAADARRRKDVSRTNNKWRQTKVDQKRKNVNLEIYDFDDGDGDDESNSTETKIDDMDVENEKVSPEPLRWLSNVWKGIGPPHFTCEVCGDVFTKKMVFTEHLFKHRMEEQDEIDRLQQENNLKLQNELITRNGHLNTEPGRRKPVGQFQCPKCPCAFSRKEYLAVHVKSHDRPFEKCPYCDEMFNYKFYLTDHIKTVHEASPFANVTLTPVTPTSSRSKTDLLNSKAISDNGDIQRYRSTGEEFKGDSSKKNKFKSGKMQDNIMSGDVGQSKSKRSSKETSDALTRNLKRFFESQKNQQGQGSWANNDNNGEGSIMDFDPGTIAIPSHLTKTTEHSAVVSSKTGSSNLLQSSSSNIYQGPLPLLGCGGVYNLTTKPAENALTCQDCGKEFEHRKSLVKHVKYYSQQEEFSCKICHKTFKLKHHVSRHMKSFHNIDNFETIANSTLTTPVENVDEGDDLIIDDTEICSTYSASDSSECPREPENIMSLDDLPVASELTLQCTKIAKEKENSARLAALASQNLKLATKAKTPAKITPDDEDKGQQNQDIACSEPTSPATPVQNESQPTSGTSTSRRCHLSKLSEDQSFDSMFIMTLSPNGTPCFTCLLCKKEYPTRSRLNSHLWYHKRASIYQCNMCFAEFKFKHDLNAHKQVHNTVRIRYACTVCPKSFSWKKDLLKHMRTKHGAASDPIELIGTGERQYKCPQCTLLFLDIYELNAHIGEVHELRNVCQTCGQSLMSAQLLEEHMSQEHGDDADDEHTVQNSSDDDLLEIP